MSDYPASTAYRAAEVLTATPQRLHLMLVEGAIRFCRQAQDQWRQSEMDAARQSLGRGPGGARRDAGRGARRQHRRIARAGRDLCLRVPAIGRSPSSPGVGPIERLPFACWKSIAKRGARCAGVMARCAKPTRPTVLPHPDPWRSRLASRMTLPPAGFPARPRALRQHGRAAPSRRVLPGVTHANFFLVLLVSYGLCGYLCGSAAEFDGSRAAGL